MNPSLTLVVIVIAVLAWSAHLIELALHHRERLARIRTRSGIGWVNGLPATPDSHIAPDYIPTPSDVHERITPATDVETAVEAGEEALAEAQTGHEDCYPGHCLRPSPGQRCPQPF